VQPGQVVPIVVDPEDLTRLVLDLDPFRFPKELVRGK
jgi:hypothetical protein